ncbi:MGH1-like glycoside hydrolase domain-containing protein [Cellulosimicrobium arenosum]|uniref:Discoidin domain-containing protein n=1 Tax=Cellulosimicrobium arenosum TaxID=2708133 RepID=A0A927PFP6_9MICO|nr:glycosyl hydrolase family 65 protein [Cellulosimicrobium arenosum]MBD8080102.1 discoidin domain-containing protein [Cellulosimicrobium arenosum]
MRRSQTRGAGALVTGALLLALAVPTATALPHAPAPGDPAQVEVDVDPTTPAGLPEVGAGTSFVDGGTKLAGYAEQDWYLANVPMIDLPDTDAEAVYYYRWRVLKEHLRYTEPGTGWVLTEFLDCCGYAAPYQAINAAAGHQLAEGRWLRDQRYLDDYEDYWLTGPGQISPAQNPEASDWAHQYSFWAVSAIVERAQVTGDLDRLASLQPELETFVEDWSNQYDAETGLYWQTPEYDAKESSPASYATDQAYAGRHTFRPSINAYLYGDMVALAQVADLNGDAATAAEYRGRAAELREAVDTYLWDDDRQFFYDVVDRENPDHEQLRDRLDVGLVPWKFGLASADQSAALDQLFDPEGFAAPYGPTVTERRSPDFWKHADEGCCKWDGPSWPFSTSLTLDGVATALRDGTAGDVTREQYTDLFDTYVRTQFRDGEPYVAEAHHPDEDRWIYDGYDHSEDYLHSSYVDLVLQDVLGLQPQTDGTLVIDPLVPADWDWFAAENVPYHGRNVTVLFDRDGSHYGAGAGLRVFVDGEEALHSDATVLDEGADPVVVPVPSGEAQRLPHAVNTSANPLQHEFPRPIASYTWQYDDAWRVLDGKAWYDEVPENTRWSNYSSPNASDWIGVEFAEPTQISDVRFRGYADSDAVKAAASYELEYWTGSAWQAVPDQTRYPAQPVGNGVNRITFPPLETTRYRVALENAPGKSVGVTELESWTPVSRKVSVRVAAPGSSAQGESSRVDVTVSTREDPVDGATASLELPDGWTAVPVDDAGPRDLDAWDRTTLSWDVTPPQRAVPGSEAQLGAVVRWAEGDVEQEARAATTTRLAFDPAWYDDVVLHDDFDTDSSDDYTTLQPSAEALPTVTVGDGTLAADGDARYWGLYGHETARATSSSVLIAEIGEFSGAGTSEDSLFLGLAAADRTYALAWFNHTNVAAGLDRVGGEGGPSPWFGIKGYGPGDRIAMQVDGSRVEVFAEEDGGWTYYGGTTTGGALDTSDPDVLASLLPTVGFRADRGTVSISSFEVRARSGAAPTPDVQVTAVPRCLGGKAYVAVRAAYTGTGGSGTGEPVDIELVTPYGTRTVPDVTPGANAYQSFAARATSLPAGAATIRVTDATTRVTTLHASHPAITC